MLRRVSNFVLRLDLLLRSACGLAARRRRAPACVALAACLPALAAAEPPALRLDAPAAETSTRLPLIEVAGGAGRGAGQKWEIVLVLDLSDSTLHPSGLDLDGDGPEGRTDPGLVAAFQPTGFAGPALAKRMRDSFDFEDTILAAELEAAGVLAARVAGPRMRTGLIGFSDRAHVLAPLGSTPAALERALAELRTHLGEHLRGTNYAAALEAAHRLLVPDPEAPPDGTQRAIVFLSDGVPSLPVFAGDHGRSEARLAAREIGMAGIRLFAFAFGDEGAAATGLLAEMAEWTEGRAQRVEQPEQLVTALRELALVDVARVAIHNTTTGAAARAVRLFPDGSFDALVTLGEGGNVLRVEAYASDGSGVYLERKVVRLPGKAEVDEAARGRELLAKLRARTAEMEAWAEVERRRQAQRRSLTIEAAPAP
jgi:von Willebrand factor type A domain